MLADVELREVEPLAHGVFDFICRRHELGCGRGDGNQASDDVGEGVVLKGVERCRVFAESGEEAFVGLEGETLSELLKVSVDVADPVANPRTDGFVEGVVVEVSDFPQIYY